MTNCEMYKKFRAEIDEMAIPLLLDTLKVIRITDGEAEIGLLCMENDYIDCLYILPEYRRQGRGKRAIGEYIKKYGMPKTLHIVNSNTTALAFWDSIFKLVPIEVTPTDTFYRILGIKN